MFNLLFIVLKLNFKKNYYMINTKLEMCLIMKTMLNYYKTNRKI